MTNTQSHRREGRKAQVAPLRAVGLALVVLGACGGDSETPAPSSSPYAALPGTSPSAPTGSTPLAPAPNAPQPQAAAPQSPSGVPAAVPPAANSGAAGSAAVPAAPVVNPSAQQPAAAPANPPQQPAAASSGAHQPGIAMDECGLRTKWGGDEYCIKAPPADQGFQIHIGPTNFDNPEAKFVMQPGSETVENFTGTSGNTSAVYYYWRQYRMRPGTHHMIVTSSGVNGRRLGGSQNLAWDNPVKGEIPPENQGVGMMLGPNPPLNINLHYMNFTDKPILKEVWVNFWYRAAADVKETANEMYSFAPINVPPGQHVVLRGVCPVAQAGRMLTLYGHRHANNVRFSVWRERGSDKTLIYDDFDWEDPLLLEFNSLTTNSPADPANKVRGGWSGMLDLAAGDNVSFECEIVNMSDKTFRGANEAEDDEMCILIGDTVQTTVSNRCQYTTTPAGSM